ncbi:MAG: flagellar hook-basal body complex protein FliE [Pseudomonadota bacterium]
MSGVGGVGGGMSIDRVMQLRAQILERNEALSRANQVPAAGGVTEAKPATFAATLESALKDVNQSQQVAGDLSAAYERGETVDIAKVMMARQQASVGFEATLQVRNKLLSAYQNIMNMPV